ncbi:hypothetical protein VULLAG_LOCUS7579 [Vulpes lagopus]
MGPLGPGPSGFRFRREKRTGNTCNMVENSKGTKSCAVTNTASPPANLKALDSRSSPHFQLLHVCLAHPLRIIVPKYTSAVEMMKSRPRAESSPRVGVLCFLCSRRRTRPSTRGGG